MNGWLQHLRKGLEDAMKADDNASTRIDKAIGLDLDTHLREQAARQAAARQRLAVVDRRYREYMSGEKPT